MKPIGAFVQLCRFRGSGRWVLIVSLGVCYTLIIRGVLGFRVSGILRSTKFVLVIIQALGPKPHTLLHLSTAQHGLGFRGPNSKRLWRNLGCRVALPGKSCIFFFGGGLWA